MAGSAPDGWHLQAPGEVLSAFEATDDGLSTAEAGARMGRYGPNGLRPDARRSVVARVLDQFRGPIVLVLLAAAGLTVLSRDFTDTAVIVGAIVLNAIIGFVQERKAERSVRALAGLVAPRARIVRDGHEWLLDSAEVVPGDVVILESGSRVPADLRLLRTNRLAIDESLLTGESLTVSKTEQALEFDSPVADRRNMAYAGTVVASGRGRGVVVATGERTVVGGIAETMRHAPPPPTPLQRRMAGFARVVGAVVAASAVIVFGVGVWRGETADEMFRVAVAMAVSAVPEGLPVAFTITLTLGVRRMAARNAIVRHLPAVETLGSTTVIGSDKTGTLTENRMTVQALWAAGQEFDLSGTDIAELPEAAEQALLCGVLTNEAEVFFSEEGPEGTGDPTEVALLVAAERAGIEHARARAEHPVYFDIPFEPVRQYSGSVRDHRGSRVLYVKGAPERVLDMCRAILGPGGEEPLDRIAVMAAVGNMAERGLRVLGMASLRLPERAGNGEELPEPGTMLFLGLQGMMDPPRAGVRDAIAGCQRAGIRVVMITGDHAGTANAIGRDLGIASEGSLTLTGEDLDSMSDEALASATHQTAIYSRVAPAQKLRIVRALQHLGHVVAVTGDGVNDAPALKAADIGIAMGRDGTDVARAAADIILADDNFVSIQAAVEEGRVTFGNIRKVSFFLVSTGLAEVVAIITALLLGWPLPFLAAQILWLNLVTNGLQDVALAFEPAEPDVKEQPPRDPREGLFSALVWERTVLSALVMAMATLVIFRWEISRGSGEAAAQSAALTTMVFLQVCHIGNARSERQSAFRRSPFSNPFLFICTAAAVSVHIAALYLPPTQRLLNFESISLETWLRIVPIAASVLLAVELHKWLRRERRSG